MSIVDEFTIWANKNGWTVIPETKKIDLSAHPVLKEYALKDLPLFCEFITRFAEIVSPDETKWFLCARDFNPPKNANEFAWDEFRRISLENASDNEERDRIERFWQGHLPFLISVGGGYEYRAVKLSSGKIVNGFEPIFEETSAAADSFEEFLRKIVNGEIL